MSDASGGRRRVLGAGSRLGAYRIERLLGRGGMGAVYLTRHEQTGAPHAVKVIHGHGGENERLLARFRREAE